MTTDYTLFSHQVEGINFLKKTKRAILADEMGLGKTRTAIIALGDTSEHLNVIVCPASLKYNWKREIEMVYPEDVIYVGGDVDGFLAWDPTWLIINYDQLGKWTGAILGRKFSLIGDEAHYIKGKSQRTDHFLDLAEEAQQIYLLTGTPLMNRPMELFNLLKAIKHPLGKLKGAYQTRYCDAKRMALITEYATGKRRMMHASAAWSFMRQRNKYKVQMFMDAKGASNIPELREEIDKNFLRREKSEVLDLPEKIVQSVPVELDESWMKKYHSAFDEYIEFLKANPIEGKNIDNILLARHIVEIQKLKQVCSEAKIDQIIEDVQNVFDGGQSVVIFTQYRDTLQEIKNRCIPIVGSANIFSISGGDSGQARENAVVGFQGNTVPSVFVGNIKAAGVGITLTKSTNVIFADLDWTPAIHDQAMDRCHRIGQTGTVNIRYYVARETIDENIMEMLAKKRETIKAVIEGTEVENVDGVKELIQGMSTGML